MKFSVDNPLPSREYCRRDKLLPTIALLRTEQRAPNFALPNRLAWEPRRTKDRVDNALPLTRAEYIDRPDDKRAKDLTERELPA
jgi:hypothetical protein